MRIFFALVFVSFGSAAKLQAKEETVSCADNLRSSNDIIICALQRSPDLQILKAAVDSASAQAEVSGRWSNPEVSTEWIGGKVDGVTNSETSVSVGIPIELGGKLSARKNVAQSKLMELTAQLKEQTSRLRSEVYIKLHRLRQLEHERGVVEESITTFTKLVDQFSKRPVLSPEQQMTLAVFHMSKTEYEMKRTEILEEAAALDSYFSVLVGKESQVILKLVPQAITNWPDISNEYHSGSSIGSVAAKANLDAAKASLSLAKSEAWPSVTVGPTFKMLSQDGKNNPMYGIGFNMPLPIFNSNQVAKAEASGQLAQSEAKNSKFLLEEEKRRVELSNVYNTAKKILLSTLSHEDIERRHNEIETLFMKGVVPSALVVEAHRTYVELEQSRNKRELKALEALSEIHLIDGKELEISK